MSGLAKTLGEAAIGLVQFLGYDKVADLAKSFERIVGDPLRNF